jgi:hypothetical protein
MNGGSRSPGPAIFQAGVCLLVAVLLAGCGGGGGHASRSRAAGPLQARIFRSVSFGLSGTGKRPDISVGPVPPAGSAEDAGLPLDSYEQVASQQQNTLTEASVILAQRCMTARGFDYPAAAPTVSDTVSLQSLETQSVGLTSLAQAQVYGYGQPKGQQQGGVFFVGGGAAFEVSGELQHHQAAWLSALLGLAIRARPGVARPEGCFQLVNSELYGRTGNAIGGGDPVLALAFQALQWTQTDPRIRTVNGLWSRCMARHGYNYSSPATPADHNWPKPPTPVEIATAEADVSCKTQVNMLNTWQAVEAAYQRVLIGENLAVLSQLQARFQSLLQRAEALVRDSG